MTGAIEGESKFASFQLSGREDGSRGSEGRKVGRSKRKAVIEESLQTMRAFYAADEPAANALLKIGASPPGAALPTAELAAWTLVANQLMNLDEVLVK